MDSENEIIRNFVIFLEENGMKSCVIDVDTENGLNSIGSIMDLMHKSWINDKYPLEGEEITCDHIGYYLYNGKAWIGQLLEKKDYIVFELLDKRLINKAEKLFKEKIIETDSNDCKILTKIKIRDIASLKTEREQQEKMQIWINEKINKLL